MTSIGAVVLLSMTWTASVYAQPGEADGAQAVVEVEEADDLVAAAREAVDQDRLADARTLLERAFAIEPTAPTAFNLALVLRNLGARVESRAMLERLSIGELGELPQDRLARVEELLTELTPDSATLIVTLRGPPTASLLLDGDPAGEALHARPVTIETVAGEHRLEISAPEYVPARRDIVVDAGRALQLSIELHRAPIDLGAPSAGSRQGTAAEPSSSAVWESPWFWTIVGAVIIAGAVTSILLLQPDEATQPPLPEAFVGRVETLRWP